MKYSAPITVKILQAYFCSVTICLQLANAEDNQALEKAKRLYSEGEYEACMQILMPKISDSLKDDGNAQLYYGLLLLKFHRYDEAKNHISYGFSLPHDGTLYHQAQLALDRIPTLEAASNAMRAYGDGSIGYVVEDNGTTSMVEGSPAARAGMLPGDRIIAVDSTAVDLSRPKELVELLRGKVGSSVVITFTRRGKSFRCGIVRTDLDRPFYLPNSSPGSSANSMTASRSSTTAQVKSDLSSLGDASLVSVYRRTADTPSVYAAVLQGLADLPPSIKRELMLQGVTIVVTPTVLEALPDLEGQSPRGYRYHDNFNYSGALYWPVTKTVYVAERVPWSDDPDVKMRYSATVLHEIGHAVDYQTKATLSLEYMQAYKTDCQHISNSDRATFSYYTTGDEQGPQEMFAELFAIACCPPAEIRSDSRGMEKVFPRCFNYVKSQLH